VRQFLADARLITTAPGMALGYLDTAEHSRTTFVGQPVDASSILLLPTLHGDSNLDGSVNINDFAALVANFNQPQRFWSDGDFNYDGTVGISDFALMVSHYGSSVSTTAAWNLRAMTIPEPTTIAGLAITSLALLRRR
jgi:hypothetical protein